MDRDTFSHIRLWCPRPFGTYSQNKARSAGGGGGSGPQGAPSLCKAEPSPGGRRSLDGSGAVEMMLGGQEEEEEEEEEDGEEEEDAGSESENTPPAPEMGSESMAPPPPPPPSSSCPPGPPSPPSSGAQMEDGRVLLDTWYVIKPGNTKEKIAFFVAHQFSGAGLPRTSAMKVKGNWATDCSKAKRRRRCSSYDPPTRTQTSPDPHLNQDPSALAPEALPSPDQLSGVSDTDLLSVAEMVALVEQRTAMALQGMVAVQGSQQHAQHTLLRSTVSDPTPMMFLSEDSDPQDAPSSPIRTDQELEEEEEEAEKQESCRVAQAIAHFESQNLEGRLLQPASGCSGDGADCSGQDRERQPRVGAESAPPPPPAHGRGEVRIAFRVSSLSLDPRSQSEPAGRPRCMFMSCGGGTSQAGARAKEKITCDLYQLVSPSSRDPGALLLASPKQDGDHHADSPDPAQDLSSSGGEKKAGGGLSVGRERERVTGFHVEVVVTGAVDQCVFYGKDSTENVQEETVCFAMPGGGGGGGVVGSSTDPSGADDPPPPGQLFFLQEDGKAAGVGGMCSLDCGGGSNASGAAAGGERTRPRPDSPLVDDCSDPSLCRLYRHVSHDFLEIRFQIQRLLEPRQYMLLLPDHIMVNIFGHLPTRALAALKCTCHDFKALIETFGVRAVDSRWNQDPLYRDDPCKQCKRQYERGDVSLCRWHPKPYHHDLPYGRSYWMCCRRTDKDTPGCRVGLHDNNWVQQPADSSQPVRAKREDRRDEAR